MDKKMTLVHIGLLAVGFAAGYYVCKKVNKCIAE
jgi:hypothetical protein